MNRASRLKTSIATSNAGLRDCQGRVAGGGGGGGVEKTTDNGEALWVGISNADMINTLCLC